ncbi:MAG TPA: metallophosphoesterase [Candidatus Diapherotrites archaeon]|uniref:Metallophosphoesterase n=1 Tax=Candidatus Iainarchaeum sp. TaxID=3101447 RepID=A0A7J4J0K4_9ARCH|nr:metallophosphoesterase [Candidatus Diapherotrites archaeon]
MEILKGIGIADLALWVPSARLLAITDLQLGSEEMLNIQGIFVPRVNFDEICKRLNERILPALGRMEIETILINGDLKHGFGKIFGQERKEACELIKLLARHCKKVILVKGNHDAILQPIADACGAGLFGHYFLEKEKILFVHGDKMPPTKVLQKAKTLIIGHQHPAITISDGVKRETFKCFLKGKFGRKSLIVMPSMNSISHGSDILHEGVISPLIGEKGDFEAYAIEGQPYFLGKVKYLEK